VTLLGLFTALFSVMSYIRKVLKSRRDRDHVASSGIEQHTASAPAFGFRIPAVFAWPSGASNSPAGYAVLSSDSVHAGSSGAREMIVMQPPPAQQAQTVVLTNFPSTATCVTPVNII
jgi:hypothetical protein